MYYWLILFFIFLEINSRCVTAAREKQTQSTLSVNTSFRKSVISHMFLRLKAPAPAQPCSWLRTFRRQYKLCRDITGLPAVLIKARNLSHVQCINQFEHDRWNCTIEPQIFKRVYRETAFVYALTASAIMYSIAKACSEKALSYCGCALEKTQQETYNTWKWGGCGDNVKEARKLTRKFLEMRKKGDGPHGILRHASEVGISVIKSTEKTCKCHGVSGSCTVKSCWKKMQPFEKFGEILKARYNAAQQLAPGNQIKQALIVKRKVQTLYYLAEDRNLCNITVGRRCTEPSNCATLCCSRGYELSYETVLKQCNCHKKDCCNVKCSECEHIEKRFTCK